MSVAKTRFEAKVPFGDSWCFLVCRQNVAKNGAPLLAGCRVVAIPRVSDTKEAFHSQLFETWQRRSRLLEETIPLLYIEGLSTRDFKRALKPLWGKSGLSRSSISRANRALKELAVLSSRIGQ